LDDISDHVDSFNSLDTRLYKGGSFGVGSELVDKLLDAGDLVELAFTGLDGVLVFFALGLLELIEITSVVGELLSLEVDNLVTGGVQEVTRMGNDDDRGLVQLLDVELEPDQRGQIQMISGLVKEKDFGFGEDALGDGDSISPSSGEGVERPLHVLLRETDTVQNLESLRLSLVGTDRNQAIGNLGGASIVLRLLFLGELRVGSIGESIHFF